MDPSSPRLLNAHALPVPETNVPAVPAQPPVTQRHFLAAFFLSFFLGVFGADRFYLGYYVQGVLKLVTFGWFGIGAIIDLGIIMGGGMRDAKGQALLGYDEYRGLAKKTVGWVTVGGCVLLLITGISLFFAVQAAITQLSPGGGMNLLGGGSGSDQSISSALSQLQ